MRLYFKIIFLILVVFAINCSSSPLIDDEPIVERRLEEKGERKPLIQESRHETVPVPNDTKSVAVPTERKPRPNVDVSDIKVGMIVTHKAFGPGKVKSIDLAKGIIAVEYENKNRFFQFPGAFEQGFLSK